MSTIATIHSDPLGAGRSAKVELVVVEGPDAGRAVRLDRARVVGSDPGDVDLCLSDERVSRRHARVMPAPGGFAVEDLESRNGTFFEGSRVDRVTVRVGANLKMGRTTLRVAPVAEPLEVTPSQSRRFGEMVGESLAMREVFAVLELAARADVTVLLEGETGTGKELAARGLHFEGARRDGPFVAIDVSALPESLVESELFGHHKGAFTGATGPRRGAFVRAEGGTLFLDELDSVSSAVQARLLRVVEERRVRPVGSDEERAVDVRLIAASRRDVSTLVAEGSFRADLFYRLSVLRIRIPPLRERREDIALTVAAILVQRGITDPGPIGGPGLERLFAYDWPGNARELRNLVDRALVLAPGAERFSDLRIRPGGHDTTRPLTVRSDLPFHEAKRALVDEFERRYLGDLIARHDGNLSAAARAAGVDRRHLRRLALRHQLLTERSEPREP